MTRFTLAATRPGRRILGRGIATILTAATLLAAMACSGGDSSTGPRNPVGSYGLLQIDQKRVPAEIYRGPYAAIDRLVVTVTGGELVLDENGDIHAAIDYRASADGDELSATDREEGTYQIDGDQIFISSAKGGGNVGTYRNGVITLMLDVVGTGEGRTYSFRHGK